MPEGCRIDNTVVSEEIEKQHAYYVAQTAFVGNELAHVGREVADAGYGYRTADDAKRYGIYERCLHGYATSKMKSKRQQRSQQDQRDDDDEQ